MLFVLLKSCFLVQLFVVVAAVVTFIHEIQFFYTTLICMYLYIYLQRLVARAMLLSQLCLCHYKHNHCLIFFAIFAKLIP